MSVLYRSLARVPYCSLSSTQAMADAYPHIHIVKRFTIFTSLHGLYIHGLQFWPFQLLGPDTALRQNLSLGLTTNLFPELQVEIGQHATLSTLGHSRITRSLVQSTRKIPRAFVGARRSIHRNPLARPRSRTARSIFS